MPSFTTVQVVALLHVLIIAYISATSSRFDLHDPLSSVVPEYHFSEGRAFDLLSSFSTHVGKRVVGSPSSSLAVKWIVSQVEAIQALYPGSNISYQIVSENTTIPQSNPYVSYVTEGIESVVVCLSPSSSCTPFLSYSAHFDSVSTSFGALDDASGTVLLLELLRTLANSPPSQATSFIFLNGEELGLLGSSSISTHSWTKPSKGLINLDCSSGYTTPASWFVSSSSGPLGKCLSRSSIDKRPWVSTFVYGRTDGAVFVREGIHVLEIGIMDAMQNYHTPIDDVYNLLPGQLQTFGDYALEIGNCVLGESGDVDEVKESYCPSIVGFVSFNLSSRTFVFLSLGLLLISLVLRIVYNLTTTEPFPSSGWLSYIAYYLLPICLLILTALIYGFGGLVSNSNPLASYFIFTGFIFILSLLYIRRGTFDIVDTNLGLLLVALVLSLFGCLGAPFAILGVFSTIHTSILFYIHIKVFKLNESLSSEVHMNQLNKIESQFDKEKDTFSEKSQLIFSKFSLNDVPFIRFIVSLPFMFIYFIILVPFAHSIIAFSTGVAPDIEGLSLLLIGFFVTGLINGMFYIDNSNFPKRLLNVLYGLLVLLALLFIIVPLIFSYTPVYPQLLTVSALDSQSPRDHSSVSTSITDLTITPVVDSVVFGSKARLGQLEGYWKDNGFKYSSTPSQISLDGVPFDWSEFMAFRHMKLQLPNDVELASINLNTFSETIEDKRKVTVYLDHAGYGVFQVSVIDPLKPVRIEPGFSELMEESFEVLFFKGDSSKDSETTFELTFSDDKCQEVVIGFFGLFEQLFDEDTIRFIHNATPTTMAPNFPGWYVGTSVQLCL
ncbi:hypothetical protein P9112_011356 [Eukaryota sp. TZLM1-RC]